jgi:glyoxylase-like metal-dependent hydrolase (beta-lactamase superfamily II)
MRVDLRYLPLFAFLPLTACLRLPMGPDRVELNLFAPSTPGPEVQVTVLKMAASKQPTCALAGEASCFQRSELVYAAYLVKHPQGTFLIDSGLSSKAPEDISHFSFFLQQAFDLDLDAGLGALLQAAGNPKVDFVLLTHVHWDHTSGLVDMDHPKVLTTAEDQAYVQNFKGDEPTVVPAHFKNATLETFAWDGPAYENFEKSHDLFGDHSVVLVPMPGHTPGALGVFLNNVHGKRIFFVGDTVWNHQGYEIPSEKSKPMSGITDQDPTVLSDAIWRLHHLHEHEPDLLIVAAHDGDALRQVVELLSGKP